MLYYIIAVSTFMIKARLILDIVVTYNGDSCYNTQCVDGQGDCESDRDCPDKCTIAGTVPAGYTFSGSSVESESSYFRFCYSKKEGKNF